MIITAYEFRMPYVPEISENSYKLPNRCTKPHVRKWMKQLGEKVRNANIPRRSGYIIGVRGYFLDERRPDIANLFKVVLDAVQQGLQVNDKYFTAHDDGYLTGVLKPYLVITIQGVDNE